MLQEAQGTAMSLLSGVTTLGVSYHHTLYAFLIHIRFAHAPRLRRLGAHRTVERPRVPDREPIRLRLLEGTYPCLVLGGRQDATHLGLDALLPPGIVGPDPVPGPRRPALNGLQAGGLEPPIEAVVGAALGTHAAAVRHPARCFQLRLDRKSVV